MVSENFMKLQRNFKKKKRVMLYGDRVMHTTGNGKIFRILGRELVKKGFDVYNLAVNSSIPEVIDKESGIKVIPDMHDARLPFGDPTYVRRIGIQIFEKEPDYFIYLGDILHFTNAGLGNIKWKHPDEPADEFGRKIALIFNRIKVIGYVTQDAKYLPCMEKLNNTNLNVLGSTDKLIATSDFSRQQIEEEGYKCSRIYPPVDTDKFKPVNNEEKKEIRKQLQLDPNAFIIFHYGRCLPRKRQDILLEACAKFINETKDVILVCLIPEYNRKDYYNLEHYLQTIIKKKYNRDFSKEGLIRFVTFTNAVPLTFGEGISEENLIGFLQASDVFVQTSLGEGFGFGPVESQACGVPAIVPDNSTGKEVVADARMLVQAPMVQLVENNQFGYSTTPDLVYEKLKEFHQNPELRKELGKKGRNFVVEKFNTQRFVTEWLRIIGG